MDTPSSLLRQGSRGPDVAALQTLLGIGADGIFGPGTRGAVAAFQSAHGLTPDGVVGSATWAALAAAAAPAPAPAPAPTTVVAPRPVPAAGTHTATLRLGSRGSDVVDLQRLLGIAADGIFGPGTRAAVVAFQARNLLAADGVVGGQTWAALGG